MFSVVVAIVDVVIVPVTVDVGVEIEGLSMGMSHDFEVAIEEGATIVRVGSSIFGPRSPQGSP